MPARKNPGLSFRVPVDLSAFDLRAIAHACGGSGKKPATREDVERWVRGAIANAIDKAIEDLP